MDAFTCKGVWWLPGQETDEVAGTLTFHAEQGLTLDLVGSFNEMSGFGVPTSRDVILGVGDGKIVTLYDCLDTGESLSFPGVPCGQFKPRLAFLGSKKEHLGKLEFSGLSVQFTHLQDWVGVSGIQLVNLGDQYQLSYQRPVEIASASPVGTVKIEFSWGIRSKDWYDMGFTQSVSVKVEAGSGRPFEQLWTSFGPPVQNLLTLATGHRNAVTHVLGYPASVDAVDHGGGPQFPVEIVFGTRQFEGIGRPLTADDMVFTFNDIRAEFEPILCRWLTMSEELDSVCDLFFSVWYQPEMYLENSFLNLAQALESFHRRRYNNSALGAREHKERIDAILNKVPSEYRTWVKEKLMFSNEPTLAERLGDVLVRVGPAVSQLIADPAGFAKLVKDTRNYLTHHDTRGKRKAANGKRLYHLSRQVHYLLLACFLVELGVSVDKVKSLLERSRDYQFEVRFNLGDGIGELVLPAD